MTQFEPGGIIFVLEDEQTVANVYQSTLSQAGYQVELFDCIAHLVARFEQLQPRLIVMDLGLPDGDGLAILRTVLSNHDAAVIIVSGRGALGDKLLGLDSGADDYLVKPVEPLELVSRVGSVLRRCTASTTIDPSESHDIAEFMDWQMDFSTYELKAPDQSVEMLSQSDVRLLRVLVAAPGRLLSRNFLIDSCDLGQDECFDRAVDVRISRLRKKLRDNPKSPAIIKTVYGAGYIFAAKVSWFKRSSL